jgi:hypothetical protein
MICECHLDPESWSALQTDSFLLIKHKNLGNLKKLKIGHDNSGPGPGVNGVMGPTRHFS